MSLAWPGPACYGLLILPMVNSTPHSVFRTFRTFTIFAIFATFSILFISTGCTLIVLKRNLDFLVNIVLQIRAPKVKRGVAMLMWVIMMIMMMMIMMMMIATLGVGGWREASNNSNN